MCTAAGAARGGKPLSRPLRRDRERHRAAHGCGAANVRPRAATRAPTAAEAATRVRGRREARIPDILSTHGELSGASGRPHVSILVTILVDIMAGHKRFAPRQPYAQPPPDAIRAGLGQVGAGQRRLVTRSDRMIMPSRPEQFQMMCTGVSLRMTVGSAAPGDPLGQDDHAVPAGPGPARPAGRGAHGELLQGVRARWWPGWAEP